MANRLLKFSTKAEYDAAKASLLPPYVATYPSPTNPSKSVIVYANVDGSNEQEVIATAALTQLIETYKEETDAQLAHLEHLFGQYATPAPQSLVIDPTRKDVAISAESMSEVAAQGWAISQPIVIKKGNIYRIKVGEASGQYVTTAMRYQYRDEQGNLRYAYKRKTQLDEHSELPVDGYLIMYGLPRDYELVVCFKYTAQYDPVVEVLTAGLLRTLAFQLGDMQDMIDQKLDVNGHSSAASVGGAMALLQKGDVPEDTYSELLTARMIGNAPDLMHLKGGTDTRTGIDDGKDVNVVVEKVWGDCIGGNQTLNPKTTTSANVTLTVNDDASISLKGTASSVAYITLFSQSVANHKYLYGFGTRLQGTSNQTGLYNDNAGLYITQGLAISTSTDKKNMYIRVQTGDTLDVDKVYILALDLTLLFPTDPDFVTSLYTGENAAKRAEAVLKVAHRLGFAAFTLD